MPPTLPRTLGLSYLVAHLTPALVLVAIHTFLTVYYVPPAPYWMTHWEAMPDAFKPLVFLLPAAFIALVTLILNPALLALYGGFVGDRIPPLGRFRRRAQERYAARERRIVAIDEELAKTGRNAALEQEAEELTYADCLHYPPDRSLVVRSGLGNTLRAVEHYPARMYGMHHPTLWHRLLAVVPPDFIADLERARLLLDLLVNLSLVCALAGLDAALVAVAAQRWELLVGAVIACVLAYLVYRLSIPATIAWGQKVKAAYDLFRGDLLAWLGFTQPSTPAEEKALWVQVSQSMMYWEGDALSTDFSHGLNG